MDYSVKKEEISINESIFEGCSEQPVDLDFSLPDYCPDIQKILKCQIDPRITGRNISGDRLDVEGIAIINLIYLDAEKLTVHCCEHTSPYSASFNLKTTPQDAIIFAKTKVEYVNCRAVSQRRLEIHGAFSVCAKVSCRIEDEIVCGISGDGIEEKKKNISASSIIGLGQQQFSINEVVAHGSSVPNVEALIRSSVSVVLSNYKTVANKIIINAEVILNMLYINNIETGETEKRQYTVPISQIVDIEGITDDCEPDIKIDVLNHDINLRNDSDDEDLLSLEAKLVISAVAYEKKEVEVLNDVYSIDYEVEPQYETKKIVNLFDYINNTYTDKNTVELSDSGVSEIIDVWNEMISVNSQVNEGKIVFKGKLNVCVLAMDSEGVPFYSERVINFEHDYDWDNKPENIRCDENISLMALNYNNNGTGSIEVKTEIKVETFVYVEESFKSIVDISIDEEKPREKGTNEALTIYYAEKGESIWEIARMYRTSVSSIKEENDLEEEVLENRKMILIPYVN